MIEFSKCRIDPEGKNLIIEAAVKSDSYYTNVYIDSVTIDTEETFSTLEPSSSPIFSQSYVGETAAATTTNVSLSTVVESSDIEENTATTISTTKSISLELTPVTLGLSNFNDHIFFVYVKATGTPSADTPCGKDNVYTLAVAVNLNPIYQMAMGYIKELSSNCEIPSGFIDMILRLKALDLALKTGNNDVAAKYWTKMFKGKTTTTSSKSNCGCNGLN